jgi:predicted O-methyltransferase YrrM
MAVSRANLASGRYTSDIEAVRANFSEWRRVELVQGAVPETLARIDSQTIAFAHIDMNNPMPEAEAFRFLWPRMTKGGCVLFDDYAYFGGDAHRAAIDAVAEDLGVEVAHLPTGQGLAIR